MEVFELRCSKGHLPSILDQLLQQTIHIGKHSLLHENNIQLYCLELTTFRVFQDDVKLELCVESIFVKGTSINM